MAGHSESFPWRSYYGHYNFFEGQLTRHSKVASLAAHGDGLYHLTRTNGDTLRVFVCECYAFGVAQYMETVEQLGQLNAVVITSAWCNYSPDAKRHCREIKIGLFNIGGLMASLHRNDYWNYLAQDEQEYFKSQGWT